MKTWQAEAAAIADGSEASANETVRIGKRRCRTNNTAKTEELVSEKKDLVREVSG